MTKAALGTEPGRPGPGWSFYHGCWANDPGKPGDVLRTDIFYKLPASASFWLGQRREVRKRNTLSRGGGTWWPRSHAGSLPLSSCVAFAFNSNHVNPKQPVQRFQGNSRHLGVFILRQKAAREIESKWRQMYDKYFLDAGTPKAPGGWRGTPEAHPSLGTHGVFAPSSHGVNYP